MPGITARITTQQQCRIVPHTSVSKDTWQLIQRGTATGNGAAGGTTVVDTNGDSGGANTFSGRYWVHILSGACQGQWKRIVDDDGAGTVTLENNGFDAQIVSGVEYEIYLSPEPVIVVDSSSGATNVVDAIRAESDDYWNGMYLFVIFGSKRGEIAQITDFAGGTGTFTLAAASGNLGLSGALSAGDICVLGQLVEIEPPSMGVSEEYIPRPGNRVNFSMGDGVVGARGGTISFNTQIRPSGSLAAADAKATVSEIAGLMQAAGMVEHVASSTTAEAGGSTTSVTIATGKWENFAFPGQAIMHNGNVSFITAITDGAGAADTLTVSPALPVAAAASDVIYAARMYRKSLTSDDVYGCTIEWEADGVRHTLTGCKGSVTLQDGGAPMFAWNFNVDHYVREIEAAPYNANQVYSTARPILAKDRIAYIGTTKTDVGTITATPGTQVAARNVQGSVGINGRAGYQVTGYASQLSWQEELDSSTATLPQETRFQARTSGVVAVVWGSHGTTFAARLPVARQVQSPHPADADGLQEVPIVWEAQDAGEVADGDGTYQKVPDFAFFIF